MITILQKFLVQIRVYINNFIMIKKDCVKGINLIALKAIN